MFTYNATDFILRYTSKIYLYRNKENNQRSINILCYQYLYAVMIHMKRTSNRNNNNDTPTPLIHERNGKQQSKPDMLRLTISPSANSKKLD